MSNHFTALGFRVTEQADLDGLLREAELAGERIRTRGGTYLLWSPGSGVELWFQINSQLEVVSCNPHFSGASRMEVHTVSTIAGAEGTLDGGLYAWAAPAGPEPESGTYPFVSDLPDFDLVAARLTQPARLTLQVAAFAHELSCFLDEGAYYASQKEGPRFGAESFIPSGLFVTGDAPPTAHAVFTGQVLEAELRTNPATGLLFQHLRVRTLGGELDVVADPAGVEGSPVVGGTASGSFWLSARIRGGLPAKPALSTPCG